jgi:hypothetical protein
MTLRRQQLHDLARAFDIPVDPNSTKEAVLYPLMAAEQRGVFKEPAPHPYYLEKAMRDPDGPKTPLTLPYPDVPKKTRKRGNASFRKLQKAAAALGVATVGMTVKELEDAIANEVTGESESEVQAEGNNEGLSSENPEVGNDQRALVGPPDQQSEGDPQ